MTDRSIQVHYFIVPNRCSVDGSDISTFFMAEILPMMIPNMAILMASSAQSAEPGFQISNRSEQFVLKANVLSLINNLLKQDRTVITRTALPAVLHIILVEVSMFLSIVVIVPNLLISGTGETQPTCGRI
jgi:hypothetical protein